jgi:tRNA G18 (ribose-2'-O)-methylase SpoU
MALSYLVPLRTPISHSFSRTTATRLFGTLYNTNSHRIELLHEKLRENNLLPDSLTAQNVSSIGESTLKAYNTYVNPSPVKLQTFLQQEDKYILRDAERTAAQLLFLYDRFRGGLSEVIRNTDTVVTNSDSSSSSSSSSDRHPIVLILDNLRSATNVGSLLRTSDAAGVTKVISTGITPSIHGHGRSKIKKTALGAEDFVEQEYEESCLRAVERMKGEGYRIVALETTKESVCYTDYDWKKYEHPGVCLILGNEVTGVSERLLDSGFVDDVVEVAMWGKKNSLNVGVVGGIVVYEIVRVLRASAAAAAAAN